MSSRLRLVAGQVCGGELAGGWVSGRSGIEIGGVTMMPAGGDGAVSDAGGSCDSVSASRRPADMSAPSPSTTTAVSTAFMAALSLKPVSMYRDRTPRERRTLMRRCSTDTRGTGTGSDMCLLTFLPPALKRVA
jgi:hypothetical protein